MHFDHWKYVVKIVIFLNGFLFNLFIFVLLLRIVRNLFISVLLETGARMIRIKKN